MSEDNILNQLKNLYQANDAWSWVFILIISLLLTFLFKASLSVLAKNLRKITDKSASIWDDIGVDLIDRIRPSFIFICIFYLNSKSLNPNELAQKTILISIVGLTIFQIWIMGQHVIYNWRNTVLKVRIEQDPSSAAALGLLYTAIQVIFIVTILLIGLSNLGIDIGALLAGLGVGGIAVALAAQNILGDLLASLSIVLDKPFVVGDFIVTGTEKGTIEHIGIKTTRLRSLSGEQLILSNKDLLESRVHNFKRMSQRRIVLKIGVVYSTKAEQIKQIPIWIQEIINKYEKLKFDRCHFMEYGDSSLNFETVFFVLDSEYNIYMDLQQMVLLDIYNKFSENHIDFAFPSRSIYIEKSPNFTI